MGIGAVSKNKRNKAAKSALAIALALLLALGGTLAWTSFSQVAPNEMKSSANPGGRLHDDFIWTDGMRNKDVYVENFTDTVSGQNIYARVQLREFLEIGEGAGEYANPAPSGLTRYPMDASPTDNKTWKVHAYDKGATPPGHEGEGTAEEFHKHFEFAYGGATQYMPTFNKNRDSLEADINGSLRDRTGKEVNYSNYRDWSLAENAFVADTAYYDNDDNAVDESTTNPGIAPGAGGTAFENYIAQEETHEVKTSLNSGVMTMSTWKANGKQPGEFWVYDADADNGGWFYWAQAIEPSTATGKLLNNLIPKDRIDGEWYYAIDAVGEFVTSEEFRKADGKCYFGGETSENKTMSEDAYDLLLAAAEKAVDPTTAENEEPARDYKVAVASPSSVIAQGATSSTFTASVLLNGVAVTSPAPSIVWSVSGNTSSSTAIDEARGVLTVADDELVGDILTVTAKATIGSQVVTGATTIRVTAKTALPTDLQVIKDAPTLTEDASNAVVAIEDTWYMKLAEDGEKVLLMTKDLVSNPKFNDSNSYSPFGTSVVWRDSTVRTWCNSAYLSTLPQDIQKRLVLTEIKTKASRDTVDRFVTTKDKVFFLTEADVFGTNEGTATADAEYYTFNGMRLVPDNADLRKATFEGAKSFWWLRSPRLNLDANYVTGVYSNGANSYNNYYGDGYARPAFWVNLES